MNLGARLYEMARATGALPFGELSKDWSDLSDEMRRRWEKTATAIDAATRADVVGQLRGYAAAEYGGFDAEEWVDDRIAVERAADVVEAGRS